MKLFSWGTSLKLSGLLHSYFILQGISQGFLFSYSSILLKHQKEAATLSVTSQPYLESFSAQGNGNSSGESRRMCQELRSQKAGRTNATETHKSKIQTHPVGFVTALALAASIEHATLQCYQNYCQQKDLKGDMTRSVKWLQILSQSLLHLWKAGIASLTLC